MIKLCYKYIYIFQFLKRIEIFTQNVILQNMLIYLFYLHQGLFSYNFFTLGLFSATTIFFSLNFWYV